MFSQIKTIFSALQKKERLVFLTALIVLMMGSLLRSGIAFYENSAIAPVSGGYYREGLIGQPIAINPIISNNQNDIDIGSLIYSKLNDLLENIEEKENGLVYILKLKDGLRWEDDELLTSDDVIFTIKTIQDPEVNSPLFKNWQGVIVERISELQIQVSLPAPYIFFRNNLERLPIIPKHIFGNIPAGNLQLSEYNLEPLGSGPYKFDSFSKKKNGFVTEYHLVRNDGHSLGKSYIKDFYFKFYENNEDLIRAFELREIDGFGSLVPIKKNLFNLSRAETISLKMPQYYAIFFNPNINPNLKDANLREALNMAIDKAKIIKEVFDNQVFSVKSPYIKLSDIEESDPNENYLPETAKKIITSLKNQKIELNLIVPQIDFLVQTAEIIKESWLSAGIYKVNLINLEMSDLLSNVVRSRNYEMILFGNILENPLDIFPFWHSKERFYPGLNLALYNNAKFDASIESIRQNNDPERSRLNAEIAESYILEDNPAVFLFSIPYTYIHRNNLHGFSEKYLITPDKRFKSVGDWYVKNARVIK